MMRSHGEILAANEAEAYFTGDLPDGGVTVQCQGCMHETDVHDSDVVEPKCSVCGRVLVYRPWCEW